MVELKGWEETAKLGKKIVKALKCRPHDDPLKAWMAHYISELMKNEMSEENERQRNCIRKKCADLILRLWNIRSRYDQNDPINSLNRNLNILVGGEPYRKSPMDFSDDDGCKMNADGVDHEQALGLISDLSEKEKKVICVALTADMPEEALSADFNDKDDNGGVDVQSFHELLKLRGRMVDASDNPLLKEILDAKSISGRKKVTIQALWEISKQRRRLIKKL